jgi:hypothetical protein
MELPKIKYYALIERRIVPIDDVMQWARWFEAARRSDATRIGCDEVGGLLVLTIFLGFDHGFVPFDGSRPILFETMVFAQTDDPKDRANWHAEDMYRYRTIEEAEAGHAAIVESLRRHEQDAIESTQALLALVRQEVRGER